MAEHPPTIPEVLKRELDREPWMYHYFCSCCGFARKDLPPALNGLYQVAQGGSLSPEALWIAISEACKIVCHLGCHHNVN